MKKLSIVLSLTTSDNDYQREQAAAAKGLALRLGVDLQILYAANDAINQSQQLLNVVQSRSTPRPDGIVFEPAGTGLSQVAREATRSGIAWAVLNREVDYVAALRRMYRVPVFAISSNHEEVGRIQGRQLGALLPRGGMVLHIEGPASSSAAQQRTVGFHETRPASIQVRSLRGQWTEESAYKAVSAWLRLSTSRTLPIEAIVAQNDAMALGARKAFQAEASGADRERWMSLPYFGVDGLPHTGAAWVRSGQLTATVVVPPNAGIAVEIMVRAIQTSSQPEEHSLTAPKSLPAVEELSRYALRALART